MRQKSRSLGLGVTIAASSLGIGGMGEKDARGDMVLSLVALDDRKAEGAANTVSGGGNGMYMTRTGQDGTVFTTASAFGFNAGGVGHVYAAGHSAYNILSSSPTFSFGTGPNFNTNPGHKYNPVFMRIAPGFMGQSSIGAAMDIVYFRLATEIVGAGAISFPTETLRTTGNVNLVSFGQLGVLDDALYGRTGDAYGGYAISGNFPRLFGGNPDLYERVNMDDLNPGSTKATDGSSGGLIYQDILGSRYARGLATHAQPSVSSLGYQYVRFDSQEFRTFHAENISAVPEPSSMVLLGYLAFTGFAWRATRQRKMR
jgi:hypothetical protein